MKKVQTRTKLPLSISKQYRKLFQGKHEPAFSGFWTIEMPFSYTDSISYRRVNNYLRSNGYNRLTKTKSVIDGVELAMIDSMVELRNGREMSTHKIMMRSGDELLKRSMELLRDEVLLQDVKVVFSRHPHHVITMSTNKRWISCMTFKHGYFKAYMRHEVLGGTIVAYCMPSNSNNLNEAYARIAIKCYHNKDGHVIMIPERKVYGLRVAGFRSAVCAWVQGYCFAPQKTAYRIAKGCYTELGKRSHNFRKIDYVGAGLYDLLHVARVL